MTGNRTFRRPLAATLAALALIAGSETAMANEERWGCCLMMGDMSDPFCLSQDFFSTAMLTADRTNGSVNINELIVADTLFKIDGTNRAWAWRKKDENYHLLTMELNGATRLYTMDNKDRDNIKTEHIFKCRKR